MDAPVGEGLGDFSVPRNFRAEDDDVELFRIEHFAVVAVRRDVVSGGEGAFQICPAASLHLRQRRNIGLGIGAGDQVDLVVSDELRDKLVYVHVGEPDNTQTVGLTHGHPLLRPLLSLAFGAPQRRANQPCRCSKRDRDDGQITLGFMPKLLACGRDQCLTGTGPLPNRIHLRERR